MTHGVFAKRPHAAICAYVNKVTKRVFWPTLKMRQSLLDEEREYLLSSCVRHTSSFCALVSLIISPDILNDDMLLGPPHHSWKINVPQGCLGRHAIGGDWGHLGSYIYASFICFLFSFLLMSPLRIPHFLGLNYQLYCWQEISSCFFLFLSAYIEMRSQLVVLFHDVTLGVSVLNMASAKHLIFQCTFRANRQSCDIKKDYNTCSTWRTMVVGWPSFLSRFIVQVLETLRSNWNAVKW